MNADAAADETPLLPLFGRGAKKTWEPFQRRKNAPSICERNLQLVVGKSDSDRIRNRFTG